MSEKQINNQLELYNNTVIEVLDDAHGQLVKKFWTNLGIDVSNFRFIYSKNHIDAYRF